jgi:cyclopropane fatty-acyl-phospholipid synthase-like methyltransferase
MTSWCPLQVDARERSGLADMEESVQVWDQIFGQKGRVFTEPHEDMDAVAQLLKEEGARNILDLGSGTGRHVVYLAKRGFSVYGLDVSSHGVTRTEEWLSEEGLAADVRLYDMTEKLPFAGDFFDAVISVQVVHHADVKTIKGIVREIERVIKKGGFVFITVPKLRNQASTFRQIEPNTYVPLDGPERGLPHHYFTPEELKEFFAGFRTIDIHLDSFGHFCLSAFKL